VGGTQSAAAPGWRSRIVGPGTALAVGILIMIMLAGSAAMNASVRADLLSVVDRALEPEHLTVWIRPGAPG
jgi:hypothetical protein